MRACAAWLRHQHTAEENLLDRCHQKRRWVLCSMWFCSCRCCYWPTSTLAESLLISSLLLPVMWLLRGPQGGLYKKFSRLAIARHIFRPPCKLCCNSTTAGNPNWRSWQTKCWTVWRHRVWINLFRYQACQVVTVCARRSRCSCTSRRTVCQQPAVARFLSQPPFLEHSARWYAVCTVCLFFPTTAEDILVSLVISWHFSVNFCTVFQDFATV